MSFVILFHIFSLLVITIIFHGLTHIFRGEIGTGNTLKSCGITEESIVHFSLSTFAEEELARNAFFIDDVVPSVQQTTTGISVLLSSLYVIVSIVSSCDCFSGLGLLLIKLTICYFLYNHDTYVKKNALKAYEANNKHINMNPIWLQWGVSTLIIMLIIIINNQKIIHNIWLKIVFIYLYLKMSFEVSLFF